MTDLETAAGPLAGIRVLDLSRVLAGPWCTQSLADLGAQVLKVEEPTSGDDTRTWSPPFMDDMAAYFTCANRSKQSLALDLRRPEAQDLVRRLAAKADVLVENFKRGTLERFGLSFERLRQDNPGLICCSISGYGREGPEADRAGYDFVIQAESGLMSITGEVDGAPTKVGVAVSDLFAGMYASQAILAALVGRARTGRGETIDVALFDCQLAVLANVAANTLATGTAPRRYGNAHANVVPYEVFEAADLPLALAIGNDRQFRTLCEKVLAAGHLADDERYVTNTARSINRVTLRAELDSRFRTRPIAYWMDLMHPLGLPIGAVQTVDTALASEQARARGLVHSLPGIREPIRFVGYPVKLEGGLPSPTRPPRIGEGGEELAQAWLGEA